MLADILEASTRVAIKHKRLRIGDTGNHPGDIQFRVAITEKKVNVPIVIIIEEFLAHAAEHHRIGGNAKAWCDICECFISVVVIEREHFVIDVGDEQIDPAILVVITCVYSHTGARKAKRIVSDGGKCAYFFKAAFAPVGEKKVGYCVVADEEIYPAVIVDVRGNHAPALRWPSGNSGLPADVGKGSVTIVMEKPGRHWLVNRWAAVPALTSQFVPAPDALVEFRELQDEQIQPSIVVIIEPHRACAPTCRGNSSLAGHICERTIAIVAVEDTLRILSDVEVGEPVVVVIAHRHAHAVRVSRYSCFLGDVGERPVPIIAVERVSQRMRRNVKVTLPAVYKVDVHPTIVVVVEKGAARTVRFGQIH